MSEDLLLDQEELRREARTMLADLAGPEALRERIGRDEHGYDPLWPRLVQVGWTGIDVPEEAGGGDASFADLAVVLAELGRSLAPGRLFASAVLASGALIRSGTPEQWQRWLGPLADGSLRGTAALSDRHGGIAAAGFAARRDGDDWIVDGTGGYVPDAHGVDLVVLRATTDDGELLAIVDGESAGLEIRPMPMLDLTRSFDEVTARGLVVPADAVLAAGEAATAEVTALLRRAALGVAADSLGIAGEVLARTVDYVKTRVQFDRPIGSFQVIKHRCADMLMQVQTAELVVSDALRGLDGPDAAVVVARAKSYVTDVAAAVAADSVQLHGAIGMTWEHDAHLFLKRAVLNQTLFGDSRWHRRRLADLTLPGGGASRGLS
jgi:alkylation response protein AidB-like acyl-CoA dehydrogenase